MAPGPASPKRLRAFSDGVIAVIITIMVLELGAPHDTAWASLASLWPAFVSYVLSYFFVAVVWTNHHHLLRHAQRADSHPAISLTLIVGIALLYVLPESVDWATRNHS